MNSTRQNKVARLIQKEMGCIFQKESRNFFKGILITVTVVRISPDLSSAKIYLSLFPTNNKDEILSLISKNNKIIRHELAKRIRHQFRAVPQLTFFLDDTLDYMENIDSLLN